MGSGQMAGGFDGWQGATPSGSSGASFVNQIVAGAGISVSPAGGTGVVTVTNTGVITLTAGTGITVNNADPHNPIVSLTGAPYTLASLYNFGVSDVPTTDNKLVGTAAVGNSAYSTYFDTTGAVSIVQNQATNGADFDNFFPFIVQRDFTSAGVSGILADWRQRYSGGADENTTGSIEQRFSLYNTANTRNTFARSQVTITQPNAGTEGYYSPPLTGTWQGAVTYERWFLIDRRGFSNETQELANSDGVLWRQCILPPSEGPFRIRAEQLSMESPWGGSSQTGSAVRHSVTGPATDPGNGVDVAGYDVVLTNQNFGSAQAEGRLDLWASTLTGGPQWVGSFSSTRRAEVDVMSAVQDFKTATTFTVVPQAAGVELAVGSRFLPTSAYIEFTNINTLTVGPSVKLGNNGAHDNVAPALAVANTAVTDNFYPFVMATNPAIITLTSTGIICEVTVNATATTCQGRLHVKGIYTP